MLYAFMHTARSDAYFTCVELGGGLTWGRRLRGVDPYARLYCHAG